MQTKLYNLLFTYELAQRLKGTNITVNALHPGVLSSNLGMNNRGIVRFILHLIKPLFNVILTSPEKGAQTMIYLATSLEVEGITGEFFIDKKAVESYKSFYDKDATSRLWQLSVELTGL